PGGARRGLLRPLRATLCRTRLRRRGPALLPPHHGREEAGRCGPRGGAARPRGPPQRALRHGPHRRPCSLPEHAHAAGRRLRTPGGRRVKATFDRLRRTILRRIKPSAALTARAKRAAASVVAECRTE